MKWSWAALAILIVPLAVEGVRPGDTPDQCDRQCGKPVAERRAADDALLVRTYSNADFLITIGFVVGPDKARVAGYVIHQKVAKEEISDEERDAILAAVPGAWEAYAVDPELKSSAKRPSKPLSVKMNQITLDRRDRARTVLRALSNVLLVDQSLAGVGVHPLSHNGGQAFAFTRAPKASGGWGNQLVVVSYEGIEALEQIRRAIEAKSAPPAKAPTPVRL